MTALLKEIELQAAKNPELIETIYFGGGTPSLLSLSELGLILEHLDRLYDLSKCIEITLEANPEDISTVLLDGWMQLGVNRLSVGVQSFEDKYLQFVNRAHGAKQAFEAIHLINSSRFTNYTIDLMFGIPPFDKKRWAQDLKIAADLKVPHLSVYGLTIEPNTVFGSWQKKDKFIETAEKDMAWGFRYAHEFLASQQYLHYEISNYALEGNESKHNSAYWKSQNWWGYGPGAHSHIDGNRFWNHKHPTSYQKALSDGAPAAGIERLTDRQMLEEQLLLMLRTKWGVERELFAKLEVPPELVAQEIAAGNLELSGADCIRVSRKGRLIVDGLVVKFLSH